jgi:hypothetical protein
MLGSKEQYEAELDASPAPDTLIDMESGVIQRVSEAKRQDENIADYMLRSALNCGYGICAILALVAFVWEEPFWYIAPIGILVFAYFTNGFASEYHRAKSLDRSDLAIRNEKYAAIFSFAGMAYTTASIVVIFYTIWINT